MYLLVLLSCVGSPGMIWLMVGACGQLVELNEREGNPCGIQWDKVDVWLWCLIICVFLAYHRSVVNSL